MSLQQWLSLPVAELLSRARMGVRLFPDIPAMMEHFARLVPDGYTRAKAIYAKAVALMFQ